MVIYVVELVPHWNTGSTATARPVSGKDVSMCCKQAQGEKFGGQSGRAASFI